jgi:hypothetical protein
MIPGEISMNCSYRILRSFVFHPTWQENYHTPGSRRKRTSWAYSP